MLHESCVLFFDNNTPRRQASTPQNYLNYMQYAHCLDSFSMYRTSQSLVTSQICHTKEQASHAHNLERHTESITLPSNTFLGRMKRWLTSQWVVGWLGDKRLGRSEENMFVSMGNSRMTRLIKNQKTPPLHNVTQYEIKNWNALPSPHLIFEDLTMLSLHLLSGLPVHLQ